MRVARFDLTSQDNRVDAVCEVCLDNLDEGAAVLKR